MLSLCLCLSLHVSPSPHVSLSVSHQVPGDIMAAYKLIAHEAIEAIGGKLITHLILQVHSMNGVHAVTL